MGYGIDSESLESMQQNFQSSGFFNRITSLPGQILNFVFDCFYYGPGIGKISTEKIIKHKVAKIDTTAGRLSFPIIKIPCFELNMGFFTDSSKINRGFHDISDFLKDHEGEFPDNVRLSNVESYWILNYRRPRDVNGEKDVYCFIENELDGLIYIYHIEENNLIDYEKIISNYEAEIENLDFMEKVEKELVNIGSIGKFMDELEKEDEENGGLRKRLKPDSCCGENCTSQGFCFDENSTTTVRSEDL